jgi:hypothetical protein
VADEKHCLACSFLGSFHLPGGYSLPVVSSRGALASALLGDQALLLPGDLECAHLVWAQVYGHLDDRVCARPDVLVWLPHFSQRMESSGAASWVPPLVWRAG